MPNLYKRAITAFIFGLLVLVALWLGYEAICLLFILFGGLCLREYYNMCLTEKTDRSIRYYFIVMGLLPLAYLLIRASQEQAVFNGLPDKLVGPEISYPFSIWILLYFIGAIWLLFNRWQQKIPGITIMSFGLLYISLPLMLGLLFSWHLGEIAPRFMLALFLLIWTNDVLAYFTGSLFGKTPFFTRHSPNKTWEGFSGGLIGSLIVGFFIQFLLPEFPVIHTVIIAAIVSVTGTIGDLFESALKRHANIKDSGNWLPGHGGLLDRLDGFIFMLPFVYAFLVLSGYL